MTDPSSFGGNFGNGNFIQPLDFIYDKNAVAIDLKNFVNEDEEDLDHVLIKQVPPSSHLTIKSTGGGSAQMTYHKYLLQVVVRNQAIIYNIDKFKLNNDCEIGFLEDMDQVVDPLHHVNTGFV
jgi:hypothetical protein